MTTPKETNPQKKTHINPYLLDYNFFEQLQENCYKSMIYFDETDATVVFHKIPHPQYLTPQDIKTHIKETYRKEWDEDFADEINTNYQKGSAEYAHRIEDQTAYIITISPENIHTIQAFYNDPTQFNLNKLTQQPHF